MPDTGFGQGLCYSLLGVFNLAGDKDKTTTLFFILSSALALTSHSADHCQADHDLCGDTASERFQIEA